jgi:hypothetical protein
LERDCFGKTGEGMKKLSENLADVVREAMLLMQSDMRAELATQGHHGTGKLKDSIQFEVEATDNRATGRMYFENYGTFVELGVSASRIPYGGRGKGKTGGTSLYIQGLISFWEGKGLSGREAVGAAFATAAVHKREGMPSRASRRFSASGERTGFVKTAVDRALNDVNALLSEKFRAIVQLQFSETFNQTQIIRA